MKQNSYLSHTFLIRDAKQEVQDRTLNGQITRTGFTTALLYHDRAAFGFLRECLPQNWQLEPNAKRNCACSDRSVIGLGIVGIKDLREDRHIVSCVRRAMLKFLSSCGRLYLESSSDRKREFTQTKQLSVAGST